MSQVIKWDTKRPYKSAEELFSDLAMEAKLHPERFDTVLVLSTVKGKLPDIDHFGGQTLTEAFGCMEAAKQQMWEYREQ